MQLTSNSDKITRDYFDSLLIETRYLDSCLPTTEMTLFGETFRTPIMTAALSHLHNTAQNGMTIYAQAAAQSGAVHWVGMGSDEELEEIVAKITSKPVTMMLTHAHGDHAGGVGPFPAVYLNAGDMPIVPNNNNYQGQIKYLNDGEVIDLGGREIEVIFTPGHTAGSTTFFDKARHYGFSGDAFGSTNLLVFINLSTEMYTAERIERYMKKNDILFLFPGHYSGDNLETLQRVTDIKDMCREILDGERQPTVSNGNNGGMDMMVDDKGVRINFSSRFGMK